MSAPTLTKAQARALRWLAEAQIAADCAAARGDTR